MCLLSTCQNSKFCMFPFTFSSPLVSSHSFFNLRVTLTLYKHKLCFLIDLNWNESTESGDAHQSEFLDWMCRFYEKIRKLWAYLWPDGGWNHFFIAKSILWIDILLDSSQMCGIFFRECSEINKWEMLNILLTTTWILALLTSAKLVSSFFF